MVGRDDYKQVLLAVSEKLAAHRKALDDEMRRYGVDPDSI